MNGCKFCNNAKKIIVQKYTQEFPRYDGIFGKVEVGKRTEIRQPLMIVTTKKAEFHKPMPRQFKFCPCCGRKIGEEMV